MSGYTGTMTSPPPTESHARRLAVWFARSESGLAVGNGLLTQGQVWAYLCSGIASIAMSLLAIDVMREIERRQTEKSQLQAFA